MVFCNRFVSKCFVPNSQLLLKTCSYLVIDFTVWTYFTSNLHQTFAVKNSLAGVLLIETLCKLRTIKC